MPSIKDLKKRIGTVKNTQQTTRAMKMVSAAKLRRAQEAITNQRPYAKQIKHLIDELSFNMTIKENQFPLLKNKADQTSDVPRRVLLVVVTSDRGLCGGFNSNVIKACQRWIQQNSQNVESIELAFVGRKGNEFFKTKKVKAGTFYSDITGKVTFLHAKKLANSLIDRFLKEEVNEIKFIYNEFQNAVTQRVTVEHFLPFEMGSSSEASGMIPDFVVKPSREEVLSDLLGKSFATQAFRVLLESQAGEHGARMSAMENATKNAGEMIRKLTLQFNKQRQASITKELLEIISGSESQKG